jgi:zinc protease
MEGVSMRSASVLFLAIFAFAVQGHSATSNGQSISSQIRFKVEKYTLANGMTVVLHEDHSAPIISYNTWFRVGSKHEEPGFTGIAHLFEHMMFTGTQRYTREQFDSILQSNGAVNNAFTTHDYTGYYENLPSSKLELVVDMESDRMQHLNVTDANLASEREVVKEERRFRVDNNPMGVLREVLFGTVFKAHSYKWPVIGYMKDLNAINLKKSQEFYKTYYAPNNAVLVVAGDFKSSAAKALIEKYYGQIPSQPIPQKVLAKEPNQMGVRNQIVRQPVQNTSVAIAYRVPGSGNPDVYPLDLLANILGQGTSSRLHKRLVYKEQRATSASAANYTLQDHGVFQVFVSLKPGLSSEPIQKAVLGEVWKPRNTLVSAEELTTAKKQILQTYVGSLKTISGKAEIIAQNEILFGDWAQLFKDLESYEKVTPEDIKAVANKYLLPEKASVVILAPRQGGN